VLGVQIFTLVQPAEGGLTFMIESHSQAPSRRPWRDIDRMEAILKTLVASKSRNGQDTIAY
jgi:hypothetical protein